MQRGYKEIMKMADDGKNDEVARLLADGSYLIEAQKKTLAAVHDLNDYSTSRNEAKVKATIEETGGCSYLILMLLAVGLFLLISVVIMMTESITKPLKKISLMMQEIEKGHLSNRLNMKRKDEHRQSDQVHGYVCGQTSTKDHI